MSGAVLVVEDDRELREVVRRYLERAGHAVHTTGSGAEALGLLAAGGIDLVVLDLGLPDVDGLEVLTAARAGREVPVVC
jgi:two-component system alkaline phosphatase synthesis response regulator PhoP